MKLEIDAHLLGLKDPIEFQTTQGNVRAAMVFLRDSAKAAIDVKKSETQSSTTKATDDDLEMMTYLEIQLQTFDKMHDFLVKVLRLNKKQADKLEDVDVDSLQNLAGEVAAKLLLMDKKAPTEADRKSNTD
ncbi:hypothetical protein HWN39_10730 [Lactobacillus rhamnosus]|uniref:Phage tail protein n=1 Tax=Lacticaseibacillus rhamnosus TaxID=47715 RepID=A0A7Y7QHA4_LACRH|nr:phage tail tube assembly chaperone [Lacticaseibacillus rhamnosus]NVO88953.1 hypothetical protein [Lacticaseibacillus rhamnosus]